MVALPLRRAPLLLLELLSIGPPLRRCATALDAQQPPEAQLPCGTVRGLWESPVWTSEEQSGSSGTSSSDEPPTLASFRGLPYGAPPTGDRRWTPAAAAQCWPKADYFNATANGPTCMQGKQQTDGMSEDCLSLNVFVPAAHLSAAAAAAGSASEAPPRPLPVLLWIHGGANVGGSKTSYGSIENLPASTQGHILVASKSKHCLSETRAARPDGTKGGSHRIFN